MKKYIFLIRTSLLELGEYRANIPARSIGFVINLSLTLFLWLAVTGVKKQIFSYSRSELILYYLFLSAVLSLVVSGGDFAQKIGWDIKNGDLGGILLKPVVPLRYYVSLGVAERIKDFVITFPLVLILSILFGVKLNLGVVGLMELVGALAFTGVLSHLFMGIIGMMAFWTTEINWTSTFIVQVVSLFSGVRFPVSFYPPMVVGIVGLTPLLYFGFFPAEILLGKTGINLPLAFGVQLFWSIVLYFALRFFWLRGLQRYEGASQ